MSGSKTILGFTGNSPASDPAAGGDSSDPRASRTIIGHDLHRPAGQVEPRRSAPVPRPSTARANSPGPAPRPHVPSARPSSSSAVVTQAVEEVTEQIPGRRRPSHSGKTGFPAFARLFGRWTTGGTFRRRSSLEAEADDISVPRDPWAQRLVVLLGAALFSFLIALGVVRLHQCATGPQPPPVRPPSAVSPAPSPAASAPAPPPPHPTPIAPTLTAQASMMPEPPRAAPATSGGKRPAGELGPRPSRAPSESRAKKAPAHPAYSSPSPATQPDPDSLLPLAL